MRLGDAKNEEETQFSIMKDQPENLVLEDGTQLVTEDGTPIVI